MQQDIITVGLAFAKTVVQVHAIGADGEVLVRRQLRRPDVLKFFSSWHRAWSGWRHALRRTIGAGSFWHLATMCG